MYPHAKLSLISTLLGDVDIQRQGSHTELSKHRSSPNRSPNNRSNPCKPLLLSIPLIVHQLPIARPAPAQPFVRPSDIFVIIASQRMKTSAPPLLSY